MMKTKEDQQLQMIFNAAPDAVIVIDSVGIIVQWNQTATAIFGWTAPEVAGKPLSSFIIPPRFREAHHAGMKHFLATGEGPVLGSTIEIQALKKDNTEIEVALSISPAVINDERLFIGFLRDITDKKRADKKINENEQVFSTLFFQSPVMKAIADAATGKYIEVNDAFAHFMGRDKKDILGKTSGQLNLLVHPAERERVIQELEQHGFVRDVETAVEPGNGKSKWISTNIDKINLYSKPCYLTAAIDITARKEAEEKLRQMNIDLEKRVQEKTAEIIRSEMKFRNLIENNTDIISLTDEQLKPVYRSPSTARITGWSNEERDAFSGLGLTHPDDIPGMQATLAQILLAPGKPYPVSYRTRHKDGHYLWIEGVMTNMLHDESIKAIVGNLRDVTQKKEADEKLAKSERLYKTIASSIPGSVICLLDTSYRYLLIEGDMLENLGYSKEKLLGRKITAVLPAGVFERVQKDLRRALEGETVITESHSAGYDILTRFIPLHDENNAVYAIMTVTIDVTELKNTQRALTELNRGLEDRIILRTEQLNRSNGEMEAFSYSVSHDLRAPLRAIIGFSTILEEDFGPALDEQARRLLGVIRENTKKMATLIDDLLAFSRLGRQDILKTHFNTSSIIRQIIADPDIKPTHAINWDIELLPDSYGDVSTLRQVWINLISNAIKYSSGRPQPRIEIGSFIQQGETVFFIKDNGVGFDTRYSNKLFKVFQRLHSAGEFEGTGVGLAIAEKIVSRHGGRIWAEAEMDKGASFYFSIPVAPVHT